MVVIMKITFIFKLYILSLFINLNKTIIVEKSNAFYNENNNQWILDIITSTNDNSLKSLSIDTSQLILNNNNLNSFKVQGLNNLYLEIQDHYQMNLKLEYYGSFENVYDSIRKEMVRDNSKCSSGYYCCDLERNLVNSHNFATNYSVQYLLYEIKSFKIDYNMTLVTSQQRIYSYNGDNKDVSIIVKDQSNLVNLEQMFNSHYLAIEKSNIFFIPKQYVGDDFNKIGISKLKFESFNSFCNSSNSIINVGNSTNIYDQFASFRNNLVNKIIYGCKIQTLESSINIGGDNLLLSCDTLGSSVKLLSSLSATFNSNTFKLLNITGDSIIISSGVFPISLLYNKFTSTLYIDLLNQNSNNQINIKLKSKFCNNNNNNNISDSDNNDNDLVSNKLIIEKEKSIIINSGVKKRIEFLLKSRDKEISTNGYCIFEVYQNQMFQKEFRLNFSTTLDTFTPDPKYEVNNNNNYNNLETNIKDSSTCSPPKISGNKNGVDYCIDECTIDQQINMVTLTCIPIDCTIKYSTALPPKTYYNPNIGLCESTPACPEGYDYLDNTCQRPTVTQPPSSASSSYYCENINSCGSNISSSDTIVKPNITDTGNATTSSFSLSSKTIVAIFIVCSVTIIVVVGFIIKKCCCSRSANRKIKSDKFKNHYKKQPKQNVNKKDKSQENEQDIAQQDKNEYYSTPPIHPGYPKYILNRVNGSRNYGPYNSNSINNPRSNNRFGNGEFNINSSRSNNGYGNINSISRSNNVYNISGNNNPRSNSNNNNQRYNNIYNNNNNNNQNNNRMIRNNNITSTRYMSNQIELNTKRLNKN